MTEMSVDAAFDMSVVTDTQVSSALPRLLDQWRSRKRWSQFDTETRSIHQTILNSYISTGAPPPTDILDAEILADLVHRDLIVVKDSKIAVAYPFATAPTRHRVQVGGVAIAAVCAIDALGTAAMVGKSARVNSRCAICEEDINVAIAEDGLTIKSHSHTEPLVWAGIVPIAGCAADTQCQSMLLFCGSDHLAEWRASAVEPLDGFAFTLPQAVQAGAAIFKPFLVWRRE